MVAAQIEAVATDMRPAATKTGMLGSADIVEAVADAAERWTLGPLVVDPVMVAKSGDRLLDAAAERAYVEKLFPLATLVTPNLHEAAVLLGRPVDGPRVETANVHGTGCTLSAAICARLALGEGLLEAVRGAKAYLVEALRRSYTVGKGRGPVDHLYALFP